jgi:hypothetical protein
MDSIQVQTRIMDPRVSNLGSLGAAMVRAAKSAAAPVRHPDFIVISTSGTFGSGKVSA